ncbi:MAG: exonuclease domain-containing protein, partial [Clostridia bacterium]|nr:exonuclease domain-containing protein [Clostridia bacterium]
MDYIIFDLEWSRNIKRVIPKCPDEIIQIGAVKYDKNLKYKGSFNRFIKPGVYDRIDHKVEEITGITRDHLLRFGVPFSEAFREFKAFMGHDSVLMSWGAQDIQILRVNAQYYDKNAKLNFMHRFADLQKFAAKQLNEGEKQQIGLKTAADLCQIAYEEETLHDAHVDAEISGKVFAKVFDRKLFSGYIYNAAQQQKKPESADKKGQDKQMQFLCPDCGGQLKNKSGWYCDVRCGFALMRCNRCKKSLLVSVETYTDREGKKRRKKRLRFVEKKK